MTQVAITGVNFTNKGAELMLRAVLDEVRRWPGETVVGLPLTAGFPADRQSVGARSLLVRISDRPRRSRAALVAAANLVPRPITTRAGWMRVRDVDLVLDASGFAYSDQWGARRAALHARLYASLASRGRPVILLPQALGPFDTAAAAEAFRSIARSSSLIFARDPESLAYARAAAPAAMNLSQAPDFTAGTVSPVDHPARERYADRAVLTPNHRMLDRTTSGERAWYLAGLGRAYERLEASGAGPYFLLVQAEDREVLDRLDGRAQGADVVWEPDPLLIKNLIGSARLAVGSRYHGLVSALSQGVPSIGFGWSHKYAALFDEYGCPEMLVRNGSGDEVLEASLDRVIDIGSREAIAGMLVERAAVIRDETGRMWAHVRQAAGVGT